MEAKWILGVNIGSWTLGIGDFGSHLVELPKILYVHGIKSSKRLDVLGDLITLVSEFMLDAEKFALTRMKVLYLLQQFSSSPLTNYTFLLSTIVKEGEEYQQHTDPKIVGVIHRKMKMPLYLTREVENFHLEININNPNENIMLELSSLFAILALITSITRRGLELRQIYTQNIALFLYSLIKGRVMLHDETLKYIEKLIKLIFYDTYFWYGKRIRKVIEPLGSELRHLAVSIPEIKREPASLGEILDKNVITEEFNDFNSFLEEFSKKITELYKLYCIKEVLLGRLIYLSQNLKRRFKSQKLDVNYNEIITIATGQWSTAQILLLCQSTDCKRLHVLYTPNSLLPRLMDEWLRKKLRDNRNSIRGSDTLKKLIDLEVSYYPITATDSFVIDLVIENVLDDKEDSLVIAQGPSSIALKLYHEAIQRGIKAILI